MIALASDQIEQCAIALQEGRSEEDPVLAQCARLRQLDDGEQHAGFVWAEGSLPGG